MNLFEQIAQIEKNLCLSQYVEAIRKIVNRNNVHRRDTHGNTILHHIIMQNVPVHKDVVKLLIDIGAQVNAKNHIGESTLHCALRLKNCELSVVRLLVERGADVNLPDSGGYTALFYAVGNKDCPPDVIEFLLEKGDVQVVDKSGSTLLHLALLFECPLKNIKLLVDKKVDVHAVNDEGETALHLAAFSNRIDVVRLLLAKPKIKLNLSDKLRFTPLLRAISREKCDPGLVSLLLKAGANVLKKTEFGMQVLHVAAYSGNPAIIKLLLEYNARVNVLDYNDLSPLNLAYGGASKSSNWVVMKLLLGAGALVFSNHPLRKLFPEQLFPFEHLSPLHRAVETYSDDPCEENLQHVRLLLKYALLERPRLHFSDQNYFTASEETFNLLNDIKSTYLHELQLICVEPDLTLAQFILRMRLRVHDECQTDQILEVLSTNAFPIYKEVIVSLLTSQDLKDGLQRHLVCMESDHPDPTKRVRLYFDPLCSVMSYLSDEELLSLLLACYNKKKNIPSPVVAMPSNDSLQEIVLESERYFKRARYS